MARFVVTTLGSLGDLHPMFPIADALLGRGHSITFAVPPALEPAVTREGFRTQVLPALDRPPGVLSKSEFQARLLHLAGPHITRVLGVLEAACREADAILSTPHQIATAIVSERLHIPWVTLTVFPGFIPSAYTVPEPHWLPALRTPAGRVANRLAWRGYHFALSHLNRDFIEAALESRVVGDQSHFAAGGLSPYLTLVLSSPVYSPPQRDWPSTVKVIGFTPWDRPRDWREPPDLVRFLAGGPRPVVVTSSTARNMALFFTIAQRALEASGRRGILLTGKASPELLGTADHVILDSGIAAWRYLPLSHLLPHADLVVHHAGIGTAIPTIQHGLPAVAVPFNFDQWYNAGRVKALGVGRVVPGTQREGRGSLLYRYLTPKRLAREIDLVATDPSYRNRAQELAGMMTGEDGAGRACDEIEALVSARVAS